MKLTSTVLAALLASSTAALAVPLNDEIDGAVTISFPDTIIQDVTGATASAVPAGHPGTIENDVWFTFFGTGGTVDLSTSNPGTTYDTQFFVWTGYDGANYSSLTNILYDDDGGAGLTSFLSFATTLGTQYWLSVDGFAGASGTFELTATTDAPAVPLPAAGLLLAGALGGLTALRRRKGA